MEVSQRESEIILSYVRSQEAGQTQATWPGVLSPAGCAAGTFRATLRQISRLTAVEIHSHSFPAAYCPSAGLGMERM